jgi:hypothetical protein
MLEVTETVTICNHDDSQRQKIEVLLELDQPSTIERIYLLSIVNLKEFPSFMDDVLMELVHSPEAYYKLSDNFKTVI